MQLPFFYIDQYSPGESFLELNEENSRHIVQVLRMKTGEEIQLTDGKGNLLVAEIKEDHKKHCRVLVKSSEIIRLSHKRITIGISLLKNPGRFEWFLEKATEIGVSEIVPLICARTEKQKFRYDRMKGICISAMIQSQQCWLPALNEPERFENIISQQASDKMQKFIAHCEEGNKMSIKQLIDSKIENSLLLIGPEGDFTKPEVELAIQNGYLPVSLGDTRLRSETAGVVAAVLLNQMSIN